jgi:uncharacterized protein YjcR
MDKQDPAYEDAYKDWLKGMKYKEIAEKYGVSLSAVKSWATRDWKNRKVATSGKKKLQPKDKKTQPKPGAPKGNKNAVGNSGGAPLRNHNHLKHGAYSEVYWDTLDDNERALVENMDYEEEFLLEEQIALLTVREHRLMVSISTYKIKGSLSPDHVVKNTNYSKDNKPYGSNTTIVARSTEDVIQRLESELTRVQSKKTRAIEALGRIREQRKAAASGSALPDGAIPVQIYIPSNGREKKND